MPLKITIRADSTTALRLARRAQGTVTAPMLTAMGVHMEQSVLNNFLAEGPRDPHPTLHADIPGEPWQRNTAFTLALKGPRPVLLNTGILRASVNHQSNGRDAVSVGTNVRYAGTHQRGAVFESARTIPIPWHARRGVGKLLGSRRPVSAIRLKAGTTIPRRPFVLFQRDDVSALAEIARESVLAQLRG